MKKYNISLFIFRRDLRLNDNNGLIVALKNSNKVIPIFIFTPEQIINNEYKSNNCIKFMIESLKCLDRELHKHKSKLYVFFGKPSNVIKSIIDVIKIDSVFFNMDYTPYSISRDSDINHICIDNNINLCVSQDSLLFPVNTIKTNNNTIYSKFTPFYKKAKMEPVKIPKKNTYTNYINKNKKLINEYDYMEHYIENKLSITGGRDKALRILNNIELFNNYNKTRNDMSINTTKLSAYIKFGCISIREVYKTFKDKLGNKNELIKQLYWREFYYNVIYNNGYVLSEPIKRNFKVTYNNIPWITYEESTKEEKQIWELWCNGKTGFPLVDACMRELNNTGFMHNRGRMLTSNFLTKLMMWHWKEGEKYFATKLIDYDPILNNGNWQWSAGSGVDSQPYFRIFNPWTQSIKHDKDCVYIKRWIPELNIPNNHIHQWYLYYNQYKNIYVKPMFDYSIKRDTCLKLFKKYLQ